MKCPKCGYISFDYNEVCPKCNKDIVDEREKLRLPTFKPNPPSLLGALTGEANESHVGLRIQRETGPVQENEISLSAEDSEAIEAMEAQLKATEDLDIELDTASPDDFGESSAFDLSSLASQASEEAEPAAGKDAVDFDMNDEAEELSLDLEEELPVEASESVSEKESEALDQISLEPNFSDSDEIDLDKTAIFQSSSLAEDVDPLNLDDLSFDDSEIAFESAGSSAQVSDDGAVDLDDVELIPEEPGDTVTDKTRKGKRQGSASAQETVRVDDLALDLDSLDLELEAEESDGGDKSA